QSFEALNDLHLFLRSDPVFLPYLYNEFTDVAGLTLEAKPFGPQELGQVRKLLKKVREKVKRVENDMEFVDAAQRSGTPSRRGVEKRRAA
ncbi:MAG: hypothetical protein ACOCWR_06990, partial [Oceanidesulfovibrio sp.]